MAEEPGRGIVAVRESLANVPDRAALAATGLGRCSRGARGSGRCGTSAAGGAARAGGAGFSSHPPFPVRGDVCVAGPGTTGRCGNCWRRTSRSAWVLVRRDGSLLAVFSGRGKLLDSKTDSRREGQDHAGGTSQLRYTRRAGRADQASVRQGVRGNAGTPYAAGGQLDHLVRVASGLR